MNHSPRTSPVQLPGGPSAALGIDFGTSHTVAMLRRPDGRVEPLMFDSSPLLPSSVAAPSDGPLLVGRDAVDSARTDPSSFEPNPKRRVDDGSVLLGVREVPVVDLFGAVLDRVRRECVKVIGAVPRAVSLTYPAAWGPTRRLVLLEAARRAGLPEPRMVPEPVAAATYFVRQLQHEVPVGGAVVVHDFGGGTFDASVVRRGPVGFEVLSVDGLTDLGGVDVDEAIIAYLRSQVDAPELWRRLLTPTNPADLRHWRSFREDVQRVKERLSRQSSADLYVPIVDKEVHLTREELERLTAPMLARAVRVVEAVIQTSRLPRQAFAGLFLVGGSSRMPLVSTMLHRALGTAPTVIDQIEQVVAHGALLAAAPEPAPATPAGGVFQPPVTPQPVPQWTPPGSETAPVPNPSPARSLPPAATEPPARKRRNWRWLPGVMGAVPLAVTAIVAPQLLSGNGVEVLPGLTDIISGTEDATATFTGHGWEADRLEVIELDGRATVVSAGHEGRVEVWDAATGESVTAYTGHGEDSVSALAAGVLDGEPVVASAGWGDTIAVWNPADGSDIEELLAEEPIGLANLLAIGEVDGAPVVVGGSGELNTDDEPETDLAVWDLETGSLLHSWTTDVNGVDLEATVVDGVPVAAVSGLGGDGLPLVRLFDLATGDEFGTWMPSEETSADGERLDVLVAPAGPVLVGANGYETLEAWDAESEAVVGGYTGHADTVWALDAAVWGERTVAVSGSSDDAVHVWDAASGESIAEYDLAGMSDAGVEQVACGVVGGELVVAVAVVTDAKVHTWIIPES